MQKNNFIPTHPLLFAAFVSRPYWYYALPAFIFMVIAVVVDTTTYYIYQGLIDSAEAYTRGTMPLGVVFMWVLLYPATAVGHQFLYRIAGYFSFTWNAALRSNAANVLFEYLSRHSIPYFTSRMSGSTANKIWNASGGAANLVDNILWGYLNTALAFLSAVVLVGTSSIALATVFAFWILILVVANYFLSKRTSATAEKREEIRSRLTGEVVDIVSNMPAVQNYVQRQNELERVRAGTHELRSATWQSDLSREIILVVNNVLLGLFALTMIGGGYHLWSVGDFTTGEFIMILTILNGLLGWFSFIGMSMTQFAESYGTTKEGLQEILKPHTVTDAPGAEALHGLGDIACNNVSFRYGDNSVFENLSLTFRAGERVGLVGPSGSGKTTLVSLLMRQRDLNGGSITIGGIDISGIAQDSLREQIALVPQDPGLFHRSIRDNIRYGIPNATDEMVFSAAQKAQAHEFISALPEGYDTLVGEKGVKLSGGQRQRVAIARAILKAAPILILDEATSSLDSESESEIQKALHELMKGKTVIAIAHRLSTIREMDRIVVLENGTVCEDGTHEELLALNGLYARLWAHQAGGFIESQKGVY